MEVNFNRLRIGLASSYNALVKELNRHVDGELLGAGKPHGDTFTTGDIRDQLNDLRNYIATLLCVEGDEKDMKCVDYELDVFDEEGE